MIHIQQGGKNRREHICASLELFADAVMPKFKEREAEGVKQKTEAPYAEAVFPRKAAMLALADAEIPTFPA